MLKYNMKEKFSEMKGMKKKVLLVLTIVLILTVTAVLASCEENADASGESAYEIAVKNGFTGTEAEWLESLKGADGTDGSDGLNGTDGKDGQSYYSLQEVYDAAVANGFDGDFLTFIKEYVLTESADANIYGTNKALLSAVSIKATFTANQTDFFGRPTGETTYSAGGAGVIYRLDKTQGSAYIITNFHVVYDAASNISDKISTNIKVYLYGSESSDKAMTATFVGGSAYYDIAVLKITDSDVLKNSDARAVDLADVSQVVGQTAVAIGFPAGEGISATSGIVSVDSETITVNVDGANYYSLRVMRVDTAINSGNSGGGLFNSAGELIGIVNAKASSTSIENIGYAIPLDIVIPAVNNIIDNCTDASKESIYKAYIGITSAATESKAVYDTETGYTEIKETVVVKSVEETGLAAGVLQAGDVLVSAKIRDVVYEIDRNYILSDAMLNARVGDVIEITVERNGERQTVSLTITAESIQAVYTA